MDAKAATVRGAGRSRTLILAFGLLAMAAPMFLVSSCSEEIIYTTGTCSKPDGTIVRRRVYQETCTSICPECSWTQDGN